MRSILTFIQIIAQIAFLLAAANMAAHAGDKFNLVRDSIYKARKSASAETLSMIRGDLAPGAGVTFKAAPTTGNYNWMFH